MLRRSSHVKSVRRSSTQWLMSVSTWLVSEGLFSTVERATSLMSRHTALSSVRLSRISNTFDTFEEAIVAFSFVVSSDTCCLNHTQLFLLKH